MKNLLLALCAISTVACSAKFEEIPVLSSEETIIEQSFNEFSKYFDHQIQSKYAIGYFEDEEYLGTCHPFFGIISINKDIFKHGKDFVRYVIYHELAHCEFDINHVEDEGNIMHYRSTHKSFSRGPDAWLYQIKKLRKK